MFLFYEYMDLKSIIKKLQDVEKLKQILLDEEQKELFEQIPKPIIFDQEKSLLFYSKAKKKKSTVDTFKRINTVYDKLQDKTSKINQRLLTLIDQNDKKNVEETGFMAYFFTPSFIYK